MEENTPSNVLGVNNGAPPEEQKLSPIQESSRALNEIEENVKTPSESKENTNILDSLYDTVLTSDATARYREHKKIIVKGCFLW